jgi:hypothetical protein
LRSRRCCLLLNRFLICPTFGLFFLRALSSLIIRVVAQLLLSQPPPNFAPPLAVLQSAAPRVLYILIFFQQRLLSTLPSLLGAVTFAASAFSVTIAIALQLALPILPAALALAELALFHPLFFLLPPSPTVSTALGVLVPFGFGWGRGAAALRPFHYQIRSRHMALRSCGRGTAACTTQRPSVS